MYLYKIYRDRAYFLESTYNIDRALEFTRILDSTVTADIYEVNEEIDPCDARLCDVKFINQNHTQLEEFRQQLEIRTSKLNESKPEIKNAVDAPHYKKYIGDYQWLDAMIRIPTLRDKDKIGAALELQVRKYLDRNGQKDDTIQELKKARFYLQYWIELLEDKEPSATDIQLFFKDK